MVVKEGSMEQKKSGWVKCRRVIRKDCPYFLQLRCNAGVGQTCPDYTLEMEDRRYQEGMAHACGYRD